MDCCEAQYKIYVSDHASDRQIMTCMQEHLLISEHGNPAADSIQKNHNPLWPPGSILYMPELNPASPHVGINVKSFNVQSENLRISKLLRAEGQRVLHMNTEVKTAFMIWMQFLVQSLQFSEQKQQPALSFQ